MAITIETMQALLQELEDSKVLEATPLNIPVLTAYKKRIEENLAYFAETKTVQDKIAENASSLANCQKVWNISFFAIEQRIQEVMQEKWSKEQDRQNTLASLEGQNNGLLAVQDQVTEKHNQKKLLLQQTLDQRIPLDSPMLSQLHEWHKQIDVKLRRQTEIKRGTTIFKFWPRSAIHTAEPTVAPPSPISLPRSTEPNSGSPSPMPLAELPAQPQVNTAAVGSRSNIEEKQQVQLLDLPTILEDLRTAVSAKYWQTKGSWFLGLLRAIPNGIGKLQNVLKPLNKTLGVNHVQMFVDCYEILVDKSRSTTTKTKDLYTDQKALLLAKYNAAADSLKIQLDNAGMKRVLLEEEQPKSRCWLWC